jgi:hypothetical protein
MATLTGPIFDDGAWHKAVDRYGDWAQTEGANAASDLWHAGMQATFQHPTGYYDSTVHVDQSSVHDEGTVYNYWLEGIGRRNSPVTRFPGYHNARHAAIALQRELPRLVDPIPERFLREMGSAP